MNLTDLQRPKPAPLPVNLSAVSQALAQAANALLAVASALQGEGFVAPTSPALSHTHDDATVGDTVNEFLKAKARAGKSDRYLRQLRVSLCSFALGRHKSPLASVTLADLENWISSQNWKARTQRGYLADVRTMFNFAVRRGLTGSNPANAVELPDVSSPEPPQIHTPVQVSAALEFARSYDANICRALAVRYFAGLRSAEADKLREPEIKPGHIEVTAASAKTRRRRIITIQPALAAWLALGGELKETICGNRWRYFRAALKAHTGEDWPANVTRHSFVSYHLAEFGNAGRTALEAGHSEAMLFAHYREIVTKEQSAAFWAIRPKPTP